MDFRLQQQIDSQNGQTVFSNFRLSDHPALDFIIPGIGNLIPLPPIFVPLNAPKSLNEIVKEDPKISSEALKLEGSGSDFSENQKNNKRLPFMEKSLFSIF